MSLKTPTGRLTKKARKMLDAAKVAARGFENQTFAQMYVWAMERYIYDENKEFLNFLKLLETPPVDIETFLDSKDFLGSTDLTLWPAVRKAIVDINKYWWKGEGYCYDEFLGMQSSGNGKTVIATITTLYHLYILGCMKNPQAYYNLSSATSIVFVIQAAKPHVTKKVVYLPMRKYVETMPWFVRNMRPNKLIESEMYFDEKNIRVVPGGSDEDTVLGEAIIGAVIDEINFMAVVENSKKANVGGRSASYDVASNIYGAISRRKKRSFPSRGPHVGIICTISQSKYKGDFTDKRRQQVEELGQKNVYIYAKAQYEAQPPEKFEGYDTFRLFLGSDAASDVRIIDDDEKVLGGEVLEIPSYYREDFEKDPVQALREIVGISVGSVNPFFRQQAKIMYCVTKGEEAGLQSFLLKDNVVLGMEGMPMPVRGHYCRNPSKPRYVHIDLSKNSDRCGIAMVRFDGLEWVTRNGGETEALPIASVEMAVSIEPDHGHEIDIAEVRAWVKMLRNRYGYPIKAVTYDGWNSQESIQAWRRQGMKTGVISVDKTSTPYKQLRDALYDGRLLLYNQPVLLDELFNLEYDEKKDKVDHPINGSKDCADAVCGAYNTLLTRSSSWVMPYGDGRDDTDTRMDLGDRYDEFDRPV